MLIVLMCFVMKILEASTGKLIPILRRKKKKKKGLGVGRGMTTVDELSVSPASDCNSNNVDVSYSSTTSAEAEFIQDNCDYQWFLDYGYREVQHKSVLSSCYDELARDLDSQLAQVDMEAYSTQDILSTLPAMCITTDMQSTDRQGEMYASVTGSLMVKYDLESSMSRHTSSQDDSSMSLCQSEPLFSPVKEALPLFPTNYSVDSLDADDQEHLIVTCQANKHNYTIAFHGSTVMEDTDEFTDTGGSTASLDENKKQSKMAASDAPITTWSKLQKSCHRPRARSKTISLPDLAPPPRLTTSVGGQCLKIYDIQNSPGGSSTSGSFSGSGHETRGQFSLLRMFIAHRSNDNCSTPVKTVRNANEIQPTVMTETAWSDEMSACYEDSLVRSGVEEGDEHITSSERLSSKSVSVCSCSIASSANKRFNSNNNGSYEDNEKITHNAKVGTSGSDLSEPTSSSKGVVNTVIFDRNSCPIHCIDRSMQTSLQNSQKPERKTKVKTENETTSDEKKPVYVLYPNYTLPDLGFLRKGSNSGGGLDLERVLLTPVKFGGPPPTSPQPYNSPQGAVPSVPHYKTTVTQQDLEMLRQKGLSHVVDWTSLTPLISSECWSVLAELPQIRKHQAARFESTRPLFCVTPTQNKEFTTFQEGKGVSSSGCSTGTAPSSGYRGSSTLLNESGSGTGVPQPNTNNPLYVYNYGNNSEDKGKTPTVVKRQKYKQETQESKRYSMFEFGGVEEAHGDTNDNKKGKRKSLPNQNINLKDLTEKEAWEDWWHDNKQRPHSPVSAHAQRLDQLIELSGSMDQWLPHDIHALRDQVSKFLSEVGKKGVSFADKGASDQQLTPPNSPTFQKGSGYHCKQGMNLHLRGDERNNSENKKTLVDGVAEAVDKIVNYNDLENIAQVVLDCLCPPLYAMMSDGLKPHLDTPFGPIGNSVWQVVESSSLQGPMTRALHELVMKLNSEDVLSEGLIKFNAFVFGLLNVRGLDAWISYIRTRESVLAKHYIDDGLLLSASRGHSACRSLTDQLITTLKPLSQVPFCLDLLYETRLLHESLLQLAKLPMSPSQNFELSTESTLLRRIVRSIRSGLSNFSSSEEAQITEPKSRPRSCIDAVPCGGGDLASTAKKRWSGVQVGSRLATAYDRLQSNDDEYPDSLETDGKSSSEDGSGEALATGGAATGGVDLTTRCGNKFKNLQRKWEILSGKEPSESGSPSRNTVKSRIPRPVTSPVRPPSSRLPTPLSSQQQRKIPTHVPVQRSKTADGRYASSRTSRADQVGKPPVTRPSSLPYRLSTAASNNAATAAKVQRRAASSSTVRKPSTNNQQSTNPRHVVTLTHRLPTDSGHLAFNEGERLLVVLEMDDTWLLCCRGDQKGLVPRKAVI